MVKTIILAILSIRKDEKKINPENNNYFDIFIFNDLQTQVQREKVQSQKL